MSEPLYLITGAGGGTGGVSRQVIELLRATRAPGARVGSPRRRPSGSAARTRRRSRRR